jgi:hypothetical protein
MAMKIWRFISIYLTAITLSLTFSHLLEMPRQLEYGQELYMAVQHTLYLYFAWVGVPAGNRLGVVSGRALRFGAAAKRNFTLTLWPRSASRPD